MRTFTISTHTPMPVDVIWKYFADIGSYHEYVTFVKKICIHEPIANGSQWEDVTTILWIPVKIPHTIMAWSPKKEVIYHMELPFHGSMEYKYSISTHTNGSKLQAYISFDLGNRLVNILLSSLLEKRLRYMLVSTLQRIEKNENLNIKCK